jgi:CheY-like chemotaxis protein
MPGLPVAQAVPGQLRRTGLNGCAASPDGVANSIPTKFGALTGLTLLIADDDQAIQALCRAMVLHRVADATVIAASDGAEAIERARTHQPDVILMDLAMPRVDGLAATRALKAAVETCTIPVIAFTGSILDTQSILDSGCSALLTKPCDEQKFLATIAEVVARRGVRARR